MSVAEDTGSARRLRREDWIDAAMVMLSEDNVEALRVDVLAARLRVTKGSFYWHFASKEQLLDGVIDTWRERMTSGIEALIKNDVGTPAGRLRRLLRLQIQPRPDVPGGPLELTLRGWARREPRVDAILREVDLKRINFLRTLYKDAGLNDADAETFAFIQMAYVVGGRSLIFDGDKEDLERRWKIGQDFLVPGGERGPA